MTKQIKYPNILKWWDNSFKPNLKNFLIRFSKIRAEGRKGTKLALFQLLEFALVEEDWEEVASIRSRITSILQEDLQGFIVRSREKEHDEVERGSLYHVAREVKRGKAGNLDKLKIGNVVTEDREEIEDEAFSFYESLFNGHHRTDTRMVGVHES